MVLIVNWLTNLSQTLISIVKIILRSKFFYNSQFPEIKNTDELVILGNGPSLRPTISKHTTFLLSRHLLCVNAFAFSDDYVTLKPQYYVLVDPGLWLEKQTEKVKDFRNNVLEAIITKTQWPLFLFVPFEARHSLLFKPENITNPNIRLIFFNKTSIYGFSAFTNWCYRHNLGMPRPQNVMMPSLILSINMNFKKIFIVGTDHSWHENIHISQNNQLFLRDPHFYDTKENIDNPVLNIFTGKPLKLYEQFQALAITFKNYFIIENYAKSRKTSILNASEVSFIDAFSRIEIK
jgi:hypothetical protein